MIKVLLMDERDAGFPDGFDSGSGTNTQAYRYTKKEIAEAHVVGRIDNGGNVSVLKSKNGEAGQVLPLEIFAVRSLNGTL